MYLSCGRGGRQLCHWLLRFCVSRYCCVHAIVLGSKDRLEQTDKRKVHLFLHFHWCHTCTGQTELMSTWPLGPHRQRGLQGMGGAQWWEPYCVSFIQATLGWARGEKESERKRVWPLPLRYRHIFFTSICIRTSYIYLVWLVCVVRCVNAQPGATEQCSPSLHVLSCFGAICEQVFANILRNWITLP